MSGILSLNSYLESVVLDINCRKINKFMREMKGV